MEFAVRKEVLAEVHYRIALMTVTEDWDSVAIVQVNNFTPNIYMDYDAAKADCDLFNSLHKPLYAVVKFDVGGRLNAGKIK